MKLPLLTKIRRKGDNAPNCVFQVLHFKERGVLEGDAVGVNMDTLRIEVRDISDLKVLSEEEYRDYKNQGQEQNVSELPELLLIEDHRHKGVEWGVSFGGSNPELGDYISMGSSKSCAEKLLHLINQRESELRKQINGS